MALRKLTASEDVLERSELPWSNAWAKTVKDYADPRIIWTVSIHTTGLMVCTREYRGYIHAGSQSCSDLQEAIELFASSNSPESLLSCACNAKGKIEILVDDEELSHRWVKAENIYTQVQKGASKKKYEAKENPLLAGRGVQKHIAESTEHTSGETGEKRLEASTRGKKP